MKVYRFKKIDIVYSEQFISHYGSCDPTCAIIPIRIMVLLTHQSIATYCNLHREKGQQNSFSRKNASHKKVPNVLSRCHTKRRAGAATKKNPFFFLQKVGVIPKEGLARPRMPVLLLLWKRLRTLGIFLRYAAQMTEHSWSVGEKTKKNSRCLQKGKSIIFYYHVDLFTWVKVKKRWMCFKPGVNVFCSPGMFLMAHSVMTWFLHEIYLAHSTLIM